MSEEKFQSPNFDTLKKNIEEYFQHAIEDPISCEIMKTPIVLPSGQSYDEAELKKYKEDPIARTPILPGNKINNVALGVAIEAYLKTMKDIEILMENFKNFEEAQAKRESTLKEKIKNLEEENRTLQRKQLEKDGLIKKGMEENLNHKKKSKTQKKQIKKQQERILELEKQLKERPLEQQKPAELSSIPVTPEDKTTPKPDITPLVLNVQDEKLEGVTSLMKACQGGDQLLINKCLQQEGVYISDTDSQGCTALMYAIQHPDKNQSINIVRYLAGQRIQPISKENINQQNNSGYSALTLACHRSDFSDEELTLTINNLLRKGAIIDENISCLLQKNGRQKVLDFFSNSMQRARSNVQEDLEKKPISLAEAVEITVQENKEFLQRGGEFTPLRRAVLDDDPELVDAYLAHPLINEEVVNRTDDGNSTLMQACAGGNIQVVESLLKKGADLRAKNRWGQTAPMYAASTLHISDDQKDALLRYLLTQDIQPLSEKDLNLQDSFGDSVLIMACSRGSKEDVIELLLKKGADQTLVNRQGNTAATAAHNTHHGNLVIALLKGKKAAPKNTSQCSASFLPPPKGAKRSPTVNRTQGVSVAVK